MIGTSFDMNEVFFHRDARFMNRINHPCNCVNVHHGDCHVGPDGIHTVEGKRRAVKHLLFWEGYTAVKEYLASMAEQMKGREAEDALRLLDDVAKEVDAKRIDS